MQNYFAPTDKVPYLLTVVFLALSWTVTHFADRATQSPFLLYQSDRYVSENSQKIIISLENISKTKGYQDLEVVAVFRDMPCDGSINGDIVPNQPATFKGGQITLGKESFRILIPILHPGWKFLITIRTDFDIDPELAFTSIKQPINFQRLNLETFFIKFETWILSFLFVVWTAIIILYISVSFKRSAVASSEESSRSLNNIDAFREDE